MKRLCSLLIVVCLGIAIVGCSGGDSASAPDVKPPTEDAKETDDSAGGDESEGE